MSRETLASLKARNAELLSQLTVEQAANAALGIKLKQTIAMLNTARNRATPPPARTPGASLITRRCEAAKVLASTLGRAPTKAEVDHAVA